MNAVITLVLFTWSTFSTGTYTPYTRPPWFSPNIWYDLVGRPSGFKVNDAYSSYKGRSIVPPLNFNEFIEQSSAPDGEDAVVCEQFDFKPGECLTRNCFFCVSDQYCYPNELSAPDCIYKSRVPCKAFLNNEERCKLSGCTYDLGSGKCNGFIKGKGTVAYNVCGNTTITNQNGITFIAKSRFKTNFNCHGSEKNPSRYVCPGTPQERIMYSSLGYTQNTKLEFDIPGDGVYELGLYMCDIVDARRYQYLDVNNIRLANYQTTPGKLFYGKHYLSVTDGGRTLYATNISKQSQWTNIRNREINIQLTYYVSDKRHTIVSGLYLRKLL